MKKTIEQIWYGNIRPQEMGIYKKRELKDFLLIIGKQRSELEKTLDEKQIELLENIMETRDKMEDIAENEIFSYGFKLGGKIAFEIMTELIG